MSFQSFKREVNFFKNINFFVCFITGVLVVYFQIIVPKLESYKTSYKELVALRAQIKSLQSRLDEVSSDMSQKQKSNQTMLTITDTPYNAVGLSKMLERFFSEFEIEESKEDHKIINNKEGGGKPPYYYKDIQIKGITTFPDNIYRLIDALKHIGSLAQIRYPITIASKEGYLAVQMNLRIYFFLE